MMTQGYLICTSILLVWQLSRFDEYTCFSLLAALAFYDLCAVLSPCGPLKALVGLMQERNVPLPVRKKRIEMKILEFLEEKL
jgi:presenilin 1